MVTDEQAYRFSPPRYGFYMQLLNALQLPEGKRMVDQLISIENQTRYTREEMERRADTIVRDLKYMFNKFNDGKSSTGSASFDLKTMQGKLTELLHDDTLLATLQDQQKRDALLGTLRELQNALTPAHTGSVMSEALKNAKYTETDPQAFKAIVEDVDKEAMAIMGRDHKEKANHVITASGGGSTQQMTGGVGPKTFDEFLTQISSDKTYEKRRSLLELYEEDPIIGPSTEAISVTDRVVFMAVTFAIRAIALFVIQWGLNTYMIRKFEQAFGLFFVVYTSIFLLWVLLVNTIQKDLVFRMVFYYVATDANGYGRLIAHILVMLAFLPIPLLVRTKDAQDPTEEELTFEKRRSIFRLLSMLTFFIWVITSMIAWQY